MATGQLETIERWHAAVNEGDAQGAGTLCTADVEVGGPRGSGFGRELVVEWVGHAGIRLDPVRWFCGPGGAVVEQDARWAADDRPTRLATAFRMSGGRISGVLRHPDVADALAQLGLAASDEVRR
ncbi:nuclear transport factor 2 family protein [Pseudonocardia sp.]|uniref:nuclear transport factor 2 family protein n=1 Tax=Pseudonocardia sp. TaxID=60912 RepID=UPI002603E82F|nr:nuclear transport factor 2 family protein [Pseudonocardia sp.]